MGFFPSKSLQYPTTSSGVNVVVPTYALPSPSRKSAEEDGGERGASGVEEVALALAAATAGSTVMPARVTVPTTSGVVAAPAIRLKVLVVITPSLCGATTGADAGLSINSSPSLMLRCNTNASEAWTVGRFPPCKQAPGNTGTRGTRVQVGTPEAAVSTSASGKDERVTTDVSTMMWSSTSPSSYFFCSGGC